MQYCLSFASLGGARPRRAAARLPASPCNLSMPINAGFKANKPSLDGLDRLLWHRVHLALTALRHGALLQIHNSAKMGDLAQTQPINLSAYISPNTAPALPKFPLAIGFKPPLQTTPMPVPTVEDDARWDPLRTLKLETDLKRDMCENIAHQRVVEIYVGGRYAMHLPVHGQNTQANAETARKLSKLGR